MLAIATNQPEGAQWRSSRRAWPAVFAVCTAVWLLMRVVFFVGIAGSDDMYYLRFAVLWDRVPANDWEARLVGNALTALSVRLFGVNAVAASLPSAVASYTVLCAVMAWFRRHDRIGAALWSGLLIATLPLDVEMGTTISPHTVMVACMALATICLLRSNGTDRLALVGAAFGAIGVITHLAGVYYLASLLVAGNLIMPRRFRPMIAPCVLAVVALIALDMIVFGSMFADPFVRIRVCLAEMHTPKPNAPNLLDGTLNAAFFWWPIIHLGYSKALGFSLALVLALGAFYFRRIDPSLRVLVVTGVFFWLWMSFGSQVPWSYKPFWRMSRFLHPLAFVLAVVFGSVVAMHHRPAFRMLLGVATIAVGVVNLTASGTWGQNVAISRELLAFAQRHPERNFVTDYHTLNEMYAVNGLNTLPNVTTTADVPRARLLDPNAHPSAEDRRFSAYAILVNPLNADRTPCFATFVRSHGGDTIYATKQSLRSICRLLPQLAQQSWAVRKPAALVLALQPNRPGLSDAKPPEWERASLGME